RSARRIQRQCRRAGGDAVRRVRTGPERPRATDRDRQRVGPEPPRSGGTAARDRAPSARRRGRDRGSAHLIVTPRAVVFDFNGTLSNDEPVLARVYQELFAELGRPLTEAQYY